MRWNKAVRRLLIHFGPYALLFGVLAGVFFYTWKSEPGDSLSTLISVLEKKEIKEITVYSAKEAEPEIAVVYKVDLGRKPFTSERETETHKLSVSVPESFMPRFWELVKARDLPVAIKVNHLSGLLPKILPVLLMAALGFLAFRVVSQGMGGASGRGNMWVKMDFKSERPKTRFSDVAGVGEAKAELQEILEYLRDPAELKRLGGRIPRGVLLVGPPGTGKTHLARALAGEAQCPFFFVSASIFLELYVGVGAARVRQLFETGRRNSPCIIFIDEIDAVGGKRGMRRDGGNEEREGTLNQLLNEMDGFQESDGVVILAATNRPEMLDSALLRPGRFDRKIRVPAPIVSERTKILEVIVERQKIVLEEDVSLQDVAMAAVRLTGAELENLLNNAVIRANRAKRKQVSRRDLDNAWDAHVMGAEGTVILFNDLRTDTAYHEAGHAVNAYVPKAARRKVHSVSILSRREHSLGRVIVLPTREEEFYRRDDLLEELAILYGGIAGEEMQAEIENRPYEPSSGVSSDLQMVTDLARRMVLELGMGERCGAVSFMTARSDGGTELVRMSATKVYEVEEDVAQLCALGLQRSRDQIRNHRKLYEAFVKELLDRNQLYLSDLDRIDSQL